jgi:hypothetical protein
MQYPDQEREVGDESHECGWQGRPTEEHQVRAWRNPAPTVPASGAAESEACKLRLGLRLDIRFMLEPICKEPLSIAEELRVSELVLTSRAPRATMRDGGA